MYRIKEVEFSGGVAGATSYYSDHWRPENGFKKQQPTENGWHIGYDTTKKEAGNPPVMIWYDFKSDGIRAAEVRGRGSNSTSSVCFSMTVRWNKGRVEKNPMQYWTLSGISTRFFFL